MSHSATSKLLILFLILGDLKSVIVVEHHHLDEEYILEHEVSYEEAIDEAKKLQTYPGPIPGCKPCTSSEMNYCKNGSVIHDHCCCDASSNEIFPFVKHTCRVGPEECKVHTGDCAEYARLRDCCCHYYLATIWKSLANHTSAGPYKTSNVLKFLSILILVFKFLS